MKKQKSSDNVVDIAIPRLNKHILKLKIVGEAPLILNKWSEKNIKAIEEKQGRTAKSMVKSIRVPEEEVREATHFIQSGPHKGKPGIPALAFKNSAVAACTSLGRDFPKTKARQAFHVIGDILPIEGEMVPRKDTIKYPNGSGGLAYRPSWNQWSVNLDIRYNSNVISPEQIASLFSLAGFAVGVGCWRPEKNGDKGLFKVV